MDETGQTQEQEKVLARFRVPAKAMRFAKNTKRVAGVHVKLAGFEEAYTESLGRGSNTNVDIWAYM